MAELTYAISKNLISFKSPDKTNITSLLILYAPQQAGTGDPSPSNIRPISGWTNVKLYYTGKNIYDINTYPLHSNTTYLNATNGGFTTSTKIYTRPTQFIPIEGLENQTLTLNKRCAGTKPGIAFYSSDNVESYISGIQNNGGTEGTPITFTVPSGAKYMRFNVQQNATDIQIELGDQATTYEAYNGQVISLDLSDSCGILYCGYIDLINGFLSAQYGITTINDLSWTYDSTYHRFSTNISNLYKPSATRKTVFYCSAFQSIHDGRAYADVPDYGIYGVASSNKIYVHCSEYTTEEAFKEALGTQQICYRLNSPLIYQLTPYPLKTLIGQNNIWSNSNLSIQIVYQFIDRLLKKSFNLYDPEFIPPAYKKYDYIQTTGTASYFNTGVAGNDNTIQMDFTIMALGKGSYSGGIVGNHDTEQLKCWRFIQGSASNYNGYCMTLNNRRAGSSSTASVTAIDSIINKKIKAHMEYGYGYLEYNNVKYSITPANDTYDTSTLNIAIGINGPTKTGSKTAISHRFYGSFKIRKGGKLIRNYFPVVRKYDGKVGFFDTVNGTFNPSIGTAEFKIGVDANTEIQLPANYTRVVRLIQNGNTNKDTSYINLQRVFDSTHRYKFIVNFNAPNTTSNFPFFGTREQTDYVPKNTCFTHQGTYNLIFYGINNGLVNNQNYSTVINVENTYTEDQEIELKVIDGLLTTFTSSGLQTAVPNGAMAREAFQSESYVCLGATNCAERDTPLYYFAAGSSLISYEEYDEHDILITKFVPCVRNSDNIAGMYDIVTNTFWPSDNPNYPFIAGYE